MISSGTTIDQLIYKQTSKTTVEPSKSSYKNLNKWSHNKIKKIRICDFFFDMRDVSWKGKTITVEYDLFMGIIKQWVADGMTKEEALDLAFEMSDI